MKILLTGHKGFIGKNLLCYLETHTDFDIETYEYNKNIFPQVQGFDWVIHIGAISSTTERDLDKVMLQNVDFTTKLFDECKKHNVNLQYSSSASLYGKNTEFSEESELDPITPYAFSKYLCERYHRLNQGTNIVHGFRYFNVYGNGEDNKGSQASPITQFRKQKKQNNVIKLFENSNNYYRDFVYIEDVCRIHLEFIKNVKTSGIYNIGTGSVYSFQEIADLICSNQEYIKMPEHLQRSYQNFTKADLNKLESTIGKQKWTKVEDFLRSQNIN